MSDYLTDNDRVDLLKRWWDNNGTTLIVGIILGLAIIYGLQFWHKHQLKQAAVASNAYQLLLQTSAQQDTANFEQRANAIVHDYPRSPYAALSSFLLAQQQVREADYPKAYKTLSWVMTEAKDPAMRQIARVRAARVLLAMNKPQDALTLLDKQDDKNFAILTDEVRGDIYVVMKDYPAARKAYTAALNGNPDSPVLLPVLQLKLSSLPNQS